MSHVTFLEKDLPQLSGFRPVTLRCNSDRSRHCSFWIKVASRTLKNAAEPEKLANLLISCGEIEVCSQTAFA